jgi:hypothetical protein
MITRPKRYRSHSDYHTSSNGRDADPTARTLEQSQDAIAAAREILETKLTGDREVLETRLGGMDVAIKLIQGSSDRIPQQIRDEVKHLENLHSEKFSSIVAQIKIQFEGIGTQFNERDKRTEQLSLADKTAIAAALQAQKEAAGATNDSLIAVITKMDTSFTKLFDQMTNLLSAQQKNMDDKINDIKNAMSGISARIDRREGVTSTSDPITAESIAWMRARLATTSDVQRDMTSHAKGADDNWKNLIILGTFVLLALTLFFTFQGHVK